MEEGEEPGAFAAAGVAGARLGALPLVLTAVATAALTGMAIWGSSRLMGNDVEYWMLGLEPGSYLTGGHVGEGGVALIGRLRPSRAALAISPDGEYIVYAATDGEDSGQLFVHRIGDLRANPLPGTTGGCCPFFSPDGQWVAFIAEGELKRIALDSGEVRPIAADVPLNYGAHWGDNDTIVLAGSGTGLRTRRSWFFR